MTLNELIENNKSNTPVTIEKSNFLKELREELNKIESIDELKEFLE